MKGSRWLMVAVFGVVTAVAVAHESHCHRKTSDGTLTDAPEWATKKACQSNGGVWKHHHGTCRSADGKTMALSVTRCVIAGGKWEDDGHAAQTAR